MPKIAGEILPVTFGGKPGYVMLDSKYIRGGFHNTDGLENFLPNQVTVGTHVYSKNRNAVFKVDNSGSWYKYDNPLGYVYPLLYEEAKKVNYKGSTDTTVFTFERADQYQVGDILGWDLYLDADGNIMGTYGTVTGVDTANKTVTISNYNVETVPFAGTFIYKVGSTANNQRSSVLVSHLHQGVPTMTQYYNSSVDNLFKEYTFRLGKDDIHDCNLFAEGVYLKGTFINSDGTNIGDSASTIAEVKTTADEALATANRVKDVSIDLGTRVNDLETVTSSHSNTITGIQGKVSELEEKMNTNTESIGVLDSKVKLNTTNVTLAKSTADLALSNANSLSEQVEEVNNQITSISESVESLTNEVYTASDTATEAYDMGTTLSNKINTVITPQITDLSDNFDTLSNDLDKVRDTASSAQGISIENRTKIESLTSTVATAAADATEAKTASTSLNTRVGTVESTVSELGTTVEDISETANNADTKSTQNSTLITELAQQVTTATETANAASTLANNISNVIGTIQSDASDALNGSTIALEALGGKKIVTILESEYGQLTTKDPDTLYFCIPDSGGSGASLD